MSTSTLHSVILQVDSFPLVICVFQYLIYHCIINIFQFIILQEELIIQISASCSTEQGWQYFTNNCVKLCSLSPGALCCYPTCVSGIKCLRKSLRQPQLTVQRLTYIWVQINNVKASKSNYFQSCNYSLIILYITYINQRIVWLDHTSNQPFVSRTRAVRTASKGQMRFNSAFKGFIRFLRWWFNNWSILVQQYKRNHDNCYNSGVRIYKNFTSHIKQLSDDPKDFELQLKTFCTYTPIPWRSI